VLVENFMLRAVDYRTACFPHYVGANDYSVRGQVLRPAKLAGR